MRFNGKNHRVKKILAAIFLAIALMNIAGMAHAETAKDRAVAAMEARQNELNEKVNAMEVRVRSFNVNDPRKEDLSKKLESAKKKVDALEKIDPESDYDRAEDEKQFPQAEKEALAAIAEVNKVLISPTRPGEVPKGDIVTDFIPEIIRQLFRFAWFGIFIALIVSGVYMVMSFDNEERTTKAKHMIYYTLIGFAFVSLAFAIVKAITDIDFFRFI